MTRREISLMAWVALMLAFHVATVAVVMTAPPVQHPPGWKQWR